MSDTFFFTADGLKFEGCRWEGKGEPILLLHEGLGAATMWRDFPKNLAAATGQPVISWSRQGYGHSDPFPGYREPQYMHDEATFVPRIMDALEIPSAHLLGHSDGGSISLMVAARFPGRVLSLILEAPHVFVEKMTVDSISKIWVQYEHGDLFEKLARYHQRVAAVFIGWNKIWRDPRFLEWNIEEFLPHVRVPTLLIQGYDDEYGSEEQLDRIARVVPDTQRLMLKKCGHSPHREQPDAVLKASAAFLRDLPQSARARF